MAFLSKPTIRLDIKKKKPGRKKKRGGYRKPKRKMAARKPPKVRICVTMEQELLKLLDELGVLIKSKGGSRSRSVLIEEALRIALPHLVRHYIITPEAPKKKVRQHRTAQKSEPTLLKAS